MANDLGKLRRSAAGWVYGPGAIIDFRAGGASISAVAAGLDEWDRNFGPAGILNPQSIREERLQKKLVVKGFRLPPVRDPAKEDDERSLVAVRFPQWLHCPRCDVIATAEHWADRPGDPALWCGSCTNQSPGKRKVMVVPVPFVMACEAGHLNEFPWHQWVKHVAGCKNQRGKLKLSSEAAGLAGLILSCPACGARHSLDGILARKTWERMGGRCRGHRPWLAGGDEQGCTHIARAVQRGASNMYFPVTESALSIPPWSDRLQAALGYYFADILATEPENRAQHIGFLANGTLAPVLQELGMSAEQLAKEFERRASCLEEVDPDNLRLEEYRQLADPVHVQGADREFEVRPRPVPDALAPWFSRLVQVVRLREVRALTGFTRIVPGRPADPNLARMSAHAVDWLPAVEVRGEGIFLEFDPDRLSRWESGSIALGRAEDIDKRHRKAWRGRYGDGTSPPDLISARFVLIHTFAHALMRQLTLDCGYSSTSLRERLYVSSEGGGMAGVLIYTASTDDDGTLGGLQQQGDPERIGRTVIAALQAQAWCSSDPLCIEDLLSAEESTSLAACHACVLSPETSCEHHNGFLDRAMLVGRGSHPELGYFSALLAGSGA